MKEFGGFGEFAVFLAGAAIAQHEADHRALERAARVVEKEAKNKIGHYQDAAGPFAGWAELADSTKTDRVAQGYAENDPGLRSGAMRESIEHVVADSEAHIGSNDDKLVYFEVGTEKQPPRSVLGGAAASKSEEVVKILGEEAVAILVGGSVFGGKLPVIGG